MLPPLQSYPKVDNYAPDIDYIAERLRSNTPAQLRQRKQFVGWCWPGKEPLNPITGQLASSTDPSTWGSFEAAVAALEQGDFDGIGYVFAATDRFAGVDLDRCFDRATGQVEPWAIRIVRELDSYTEISPSGSGLHIIAEAKVPTGGNKCGPVEMYDSARYFTLSGERLAGTPPDIQSRQAEVEGLHRRIFGERITAVETPTTPCPGSSLEDAEIIERAMSYKHGDKFARLWSGDRSGYPSPSESDLALIGILLFWSGGDVGQADRLFRQSALMRPKWERFDYRKRTFKRALEGKTEFYTPPRQIKQSKSKAHRVWRCAR